MSDAARPEGSDPVRARPRAVRRRKGDREEAFAFWAGLPDDQRTFAAVADRFGVSESGVKRWVREERWAERWAGIQEAARRETTEQLVKARQERVEDQLRLTQKARAQFEASIDSGAYQVTGRDVAALARIEALLEGEPTDRVVERVELDATIRLGLEVALRHVPPDRRLAFIEDFERTLGGGDQPGELGEAA